jgi:hypothetical protein
MSLFGILDVLSGRPRYWIGNSDIWHPRMSVTAVKDSSAPNMLVTEHFAKFMQRPDASPKMDKSSLIVVASRVSGYANRITSSAYMLAELVIDPWLVQSPDDSLFLRSDEQTTKDLHAQDEQELFLYEHFVDSKVLPS